MKKRITIVCLLAMIIANGLAQTKNDTVVLEAGNGSWVPIPSAEIDKKTKKSVVWRMFPPSKPLVLMLYLLIYSMQKVTHIRQCLGG